MSRSAAILIFFVLPAMWITACGTAPSGDPEPSSQARENKGGTDYPSSSGQPPEVFLSDQSPEKVLMVVNRSSAVSRRIAAYYRQKRNVPHRNLCEVETTENEEIPREIFEQQIALPIAGCLETLNLAEDILYIVTTLGIPLKVAGSTGLDGDAASVDSELTLLYQRIQGVQHSNEGYVANPFFRKRDARFTLDRFPIYLVCRLAGFDFAEVKRMIDSGLMARNRGKFVVDLKSEDDRDGNNWLRNVAILLPSDRVVMDESPSVLYDQRDVVGYASWGSNDANRTRRFLGFRWLPGAIASEFVSTNGRTLQRPPEGWIPGSDWKDARKHFFQSPQSLTADYIYQGASAATGHVYEPYLALTPRPDYLLPAYYSGRNLAESYYLSIPVLSWQNIVIGDPLCAIGKPH